MKNNAQTAKNRALKRLQELRKGALGYADCLESLGFSLQSANLTLKDIGTTEEELEACRVRGCKIGALAWLSVLRKGTERPGEFLVSLEEDRRLGNLTYDDLGTSAQEIASFGMPLRPLRDPALALFYV